MKILLPVMLILLCSCNAVQNAVQKARQALVGVEQPILPEDTTPTYKVVPPPALENDKVVQITPKERLLSLMAQFNRGPDDALLALTMEEFNKQKQLFGIKRDAELVTALNGTIPWVQEKNKQAIQLLVQLHGVLVGENQEFLRTVLARGFDSAPTLTIGLLNKFEQDKNCTLITITPEEVIKEERYNYLENRLSTVAPARLVSGQTALYLPYIDTCLAQLRMEMTKEAPPAEVIPQPVETPAIEPTSSPTPSL